MKQQSQPFLSSKLLSLKASLRKAVPFIKTRDEWSVGIYTGEDPFSIRPSSQLPNPVLSAADVTDIQAAFIADPFLVREGGLWYMFSEVLNAANGIGVIALATSKDGFHWHYERVVLSEEFHLSYPQVFKWQDTYYMLPESPAWNTVRLYEAKNFPTEWHFKKNVLDGMNYTDPSVFFYGGKWWMFVGTGNNDTLCLYFADDPTDAWISHPANPIVKGDSRIARPGGRVLVYDNRVFRFAQDCYLRYGHQLHAFEVTELTTTRYEERRVGDKPFLAPSRRGWNSHGMHQVDIQQLDDGRWIACVDGYQRKRGL